MIQLLPVPAKIHAVVYSDHDGCDHIISLHRSERHAKLKMQAVKDENLSYQQNYLRVEDTEVED